MEFENYMTENFMDHYELITVQNAIYLNRLKSSMVWVRKRTIPTERPPLIGGQLLRIEGATWSAWRIPTAVFSIF
jgi:hypothetical protein